jgi:hypothetical protein
VTRQRDAFNCEPLAALARQLLYAPHDKRLEQVPRIEQLHDEIDPAATYPVDYFVYRITRFRRADEGNSVLLVGEAAMPDLRLMIDKLTRELTLRITDEPGTLTVDDLALKMNVSTKTIARWRHAGLRWRWVVSRSGTRRVIAFTPRAVERFIAEQGDRVERASRFTQIPAADRHRLLERAAAVAASFGEDTTLNRVASELALESGRALETMRQLLERHERERLSAGQPPLFTAASPLTPQQKRLIARAHRMGVGVQKMVERFRRSRATIYRVIHERRAAAARRMRLEWTPNPNFTRDDADTVILRGEVEAYPANRPRGVPTVAVDDLPEPLRPLYRQPPIPDDRQRSLFVRFNYLKFKAARIRDDLDRYEPRAAELDAFDACIRDARAIRDLLVKANLPAVLSLAKRQMIGDRDRSTHRLLQLLELGVPVLIESVEQYNPARPQPFDSFLSNRLMKHFVAVQATGGRAARRIPADLLLKRMLDHANESGVSLAIDP